MRQWRYPGPQHLYLPVSTCVRRGRLQSRCVFVCVCVCVCVWKERIETEISYVFCALAMFLSLFFIIITVCVILEISFGLWDHVFIVLRTRDNLFL